MKSPIRLFALLLSFFFVAAAQASPQLGLQTWTCRNMSFEEVVVFAAKQGITQLEFFKGHIDPSAPPEENMRKKAFLKKHGVTAYSIGVSGTSMDQAKNRELFEVAKLFGMKVIVVEPKEPAQWDLLEALVREYDIKLAVHNHGTGGWVTAAGFDADVTFKNYGDRVFDMHLKDKRLDHEDDRGRPLDTMIGLGNANYLGLFESMRASNWTGVMAIETDSGEFQKDPTEFVSRAKAFFDAHFPHKH
jgi:sugar phosphate isomerase/epimerase